MRRRLIMFAALLLAGSAASCGTLPLACTLIGCADGLNVQLTGALPAEYTVTARVGNVTRSIECSPRFDCRGRVFFEEFTPAQVEIEVAGEGMNVRREVTPGYATSYPNGRECGPACRQATVTISW